MPVIHQCISTGVVLHLFKIFDWKSVCVSVRFNDLDGLKNVYTNKNSEHLNLEKLQVL